MVSFNKYNPYQSATVKRGKGNLHAVAKKG